jgi:hypothetical protein
MTPSFARLPARSLIAVLSVATLATACSNSVAGSGTAAAPARATSAVNTRQSTAAPAPARALNPCELLTRAEAETLAGTHLAAAVSAGADGTPTLCQYTGPPTGPTAQVEIIVGDGVVKELQIDRDSLKHPFRTIDGPGYVEYEEDDNIFVHKNQEWAQINLFLLNAPAQNRAPLATAAALVASRM